jgi:transcriptional regulator with XRE-family HTH domain
MSDVRDNLQSGSNISARLKEAREARGLSLDEVATKTRVPIRHLHHIDNGDWDSLPAITYSVGFVRSYANAVGLNGMQLGQETRELLGGAQTHSASTPYEPADPSRVPPRSLALVAGLLALLLAAGYFIWRTSAVDEPDMLEQATAEQPVAPAPLTPAPAPAAQQPLGGPTAPAAAATGPVVLTALSDVWVRVYNAGGGPSLLQRQMKAGETFEVPATAERPLIRTARAEALKVRVGNTELPQLAPPGAVSGLSLAPQDLLGGGQSAPPAAAPAPQSSAPLTE